VSRLAEDLQQGVAVKVNSTLPEDPEEQKKNSIGGKRPLVTEPIPRYTEADDETISKFLEIHGPPDLNSL
jgi:hypothetical protein